MIYGREQFGGKGEDICCGATGVRMRMPAYDPQPSVPDYEFVRTQVVSGSDIFTDNATVDFSISPADSTNFVGTVIVAGSIVANEEDTQPMHMEANCIECRPNPGLGAWSFVTPHAEIFVANSPADINNAVFVRRTIGIDTEEWTITTTLTAYIRNGEVYRPVFGPLSVRETFALAERYFTRQFDASRISYVECVTQKQNWGSCVPPSHYWLPIEDANIRTYLFHTDAEWRGIQAAPSDGSTRTSYMRITSTHLHCQVYGAVQQAVEWKSPGPAGSSGVFSAFGLQANLVASFADRDQYGPFQPFNTDIYSVYCSPYTSRGVVVVNDTAASFVHTLSSRPIESAHRYCVGFRGVAGPGLPATLPLGDSVLARGYRVTVFPQILESDALPVVPLTSQQVHDAEQAVFLGYLGFHNSSPSLTTETSVLNNQLVREVLDAESGDPANPERKGSGIQYGRDFANCVRFTGNSRRCTVPTFTGQAIAGLSITCNADGLSEGYSSPASLALSHNRTLTGLTRDKWIAIKLLNGNYGLSTSRLDGVWLGSNSFLGVSNNTNSVQIDLTGRNVALPAVAGDLLLSAADDGDVVATTYFGPVSGSVWFNTLMGWNNLVAQGKTVVVRSSPSVLQAAGVTPSPTAKLSEFMLEAYKKLITVNSTARSDQDFINRWSVDYRYGSYGPGIWFCYSVDDYASWPSTHPHMGAILGPGSSWSVAASRTTMFCRIAQETRVAARTSPPRLRFELIGRTDCNAQCDEITCDLHEVEKDGSGGWRMGQFVESLPAVDYITAKSSAESAVAFTLQATDEQSDAFMNFEPITFYPDEFALSLGNITTQAVEFPLQITLQATA